MNLQRKQLLEKIIQINALSPACADLIYEIAARTPQSYKKKLDAIEELVKNSEEDTPLSDAEKALDKKSHQIYLYAIRLSPLYKLFKQVPVLSQNLPQEVAAFFSFSDITPHPDQSVVLYSRDELFMQIFGNMINGVYLSSDKILVDNLSLLISIDKAYPELFRNLVILAQSWDWVAQLNGIRDSLDLIEKNVIRLSKPAGNILETLKFKKFDNKEGVSPGNQLQDDPEMQVIPPPEKLLFGKTRNILIIHPQEISFYVSIKKDLPNYSDILSQEVRLEATFEQKSDIIAATILKKIRKTSPEIFTERTQEATDAINLRIEAAKYFVENRQFAKFDVLNYRWPELAAELLNNRPRFLAFETRMLEPTATNSQDEEMDIDRLLARYRSDDGLLHFLRLRPRFSGIDSKKAREILNLSTPFAQAAGRENPEHREASSPETRLPDKYENVFVVISKISEIPEKNKITFADYESACYELSDRLGKNHPQLKDVNFLANKLLNIVRNNESQRITQTGKANTEEELFSIEEIINNLSNISQTNLNESFLGLCNTKYSIKISSKIGESVATVSIPWQFVTNLRNSTSRIIGQRGLLVNEARAENIAYRSNEPVLSSKDIAEQIPPQKLVSLILQDIGKQLYSLVFANPNFDNFFSTIIMAPSEKIRVVIKVEESKLWILPWECLYLPKMNLALGLATRYSIVREISETFTTYTPSWIPPLRILAIFSSPVDVSRLDLSQDEKVLSDVLADSIKAGNVTLNVIQNATLEKIMGLLRTVRPNIVHFSGHGYFDVEAGLGALIIEDEEGRAIKLHSNKFGNLLRDQNVSLVVLDACDTATQDLNDAVTSVAGNLVSSGVPAVIATTKIVFVPQSLKFTRELYRALVDGYSIESALVEARKRVNADEWDWSAYALFASSRDLEKYKFITPNSQARN